MRMKHGSGRGVATSAKPRLLAAFTAVAMMFATAVPALTPRTARAAEAGICAPQDITMGDDTSDAQIDDGIATWVGRDMYVGAPTGADTYNASTQPYPSYAVEAEGTTLVAGKLAINAKKESWGGRGFRFGIVGFGAQYRPLAGSDSLVVNNTNSIINLTDLNGQAVSALGYNATGRGWIGTTTDDESNYNAKINGKESAAIGLKGMTPGTDYTDGVPADSGWKSIYSTSAGSVVNWGQTDPLKTVNLNSDTRNYSENTKAITELSDMLGAIPGQETSKVTVDLTAPSTDVEYGYIRNKYNSDKKNEDGTAVHIGVKVTFNDSNYKEKMIEFDGGSQNKNSTIVFDVNATDLNSDGANGLVFSFKNINEGASVVINVKGNQAVEFHNGWRFWWNGDEISNGYVWDAPEKTKKAYEQASQAIMWNFQNTPKLTIHGGVLTAGQAERWANTTNEDMGGQIIAGTTSDVAVTVEDDPAAAMIGSILVPRGSFEDHVTTNGRVWVGQDFMMYNPTVAVNFPDGVGEGDSSSVIDMDQERHNFPWRGSLRSECSTISWTKVDESGNTLPGSTWGVYKNEEDAVAEQNALYPAVKDNDIPSGDWDTADGKFRVDSLEPDATYYIKELTAPQGYVKSDNIYAIHTTNTGSISNKEIIAVYDKDGNPIEDQSQWGIKNDVPGTDGGTVPGIINKPQGGSVQWGKYADGDSSHKGLPGSVWTLTKTDADGWSQEIADNTKAVEGIQLFNGENDVTSGALEVNEGSTLNLTAKVLPEDATQDVTWSSSLPDDVEVQDGHVTVLHVPANNEPVVITATTVDTNASGDRLEAHVTLTVKSVELNSLTLKYNGQEAPASISTTVGNTITLTATADPGVLNSSITWESSDPSVATVDNGVVTPLKAGTTTIWAKCKDDQTKWKSVEIKVTNPVSNTTAVYVHWLNASTAPRIYYWDANGEGFKWEERPAMEPASCAGSDWYKYDVPIVGKSFNVKVTMGSDTNTYKVNGSDDISIAGTEKAYNIDNGKVNSGAPSGCSVTRSAARDAAPLQASDDAESVSSPKQDAEDTASLQTFRKVRMQIQGRDAAYVDSNSQIGQFTILNLPAGDYTLQEKTAPSGYLLNPTVYTFTIGSDGKVTWTGDVKPSIVGDMGWISDKPTQVVWEKVDSDDDDAPLAGSGWTIEQKILDEEGQPTWKTINEVLDCTQSPCDASVTYKDEDPEPGKFLVKKLPVGTYRITETTVPTGYEAEDVSYEFEIKADGEGVVTVTGSPIGNKRLLGTVDWTKVSSEALDTPLAGAEWKIKFKAEGAADFGDEYTVTDCTSGTCAVPEDASQPAWTYDRDATTGVFKLSDLAWGEYQFTESKAPDGYYPSDKTYTFTVSKDSLSGITISVDGGTSLDGGNRIPNTPGFELPATGGEGNTLIVLFGFALTAISMLGYAIAMRKRV